MNAEVKHVMRAEVIGSSFNRDPELLLPEYPRFIKELKMVPYGTSGVMFIGGQGTQIISGKSARVFLPRLIEYLDGTRNLVALAEIFPQHGINGIFNAISLLYSRGLLENGPITELSDQTLAPVASFAGRYADVTRINPSREAVLERLADTTVTVLVADDNHLSDYESLIYALTDLGFKEVLRCDHIDDLNKHSGLVVAVFFDKRCEQRAWMRQVNHLNLIALHACLSEGLVEIGPLLVPKLTGCFDCFEAVRAQKAGTPTNDSKFWMSVIGLNVFHIASRVGKNDLYGTCRVHRLDNLYDQFSQVKVARLPGCKTCGMDHCNPESLSDAALKTWRLHNASIIVSGYKYRTPKEHQSHYAAANISISEEPAKPMLGVEKVPLPDELAFSAAPCWSEQNDKESRITLIQFSNLLRYTAGYQPVTGGIRRIAPSGGGLGSSELYISVRDIDGLENGIYHYFGPTHELERLGYVSDEVMAGTLGVNENELPQAVLICAANMEKLRQKYDNFSYRLSAVDAGVGQSFVLTLLASFNVPAIEYSDARDKVLANVIKLPTRGNKFHIAFVMGVGEAAGAEKNESLNMHHNFYVDQLIESSQHVVPSAPRYLCEQPIPHCHTEEQLSLSSVLLARRSIRDFSNRTPSRTLISNALDVAHYMHKTANSISRFNVELNTYVAFTQNVGDHPPGIYLVTQNKLVKQRAIESGEVLEPMMLQRGFARAPVVVFINGNMHSALSNYDAPGYREVLKRAGTYASALLMGAESQGLKGCIWGGLYEEMWGEILNIDRFSSCPLLGVSLGFEVEQ